MYYNVKHMRKKRTFSRWIKIVSVISKYFIFYKISKCRKDIFGTRLRYACEELGPIFIKLGQILSTRYDILSNENCAELQKLLDQVEPIPFQTVEDIIQKDFGKKYTAVFKTFEKTPLASASIAQVHRATLPDGRFSAVKIRRPEIKEHVESDISVLKQVVSVAELFSPTLRHIDAKHIVSQLRDWILMEMDFKQEVENIKRMKNYLAHAAEYTKTSEDESGNLVIPDVYEEYCTENIIVMEFIDGVPLSKFETVKNNPEYDVMLSAKTMAMFNLRHFLIARNDEYMFHADPHPANMLILPHGKIALVDFGLIGVLAPKETRQIADLLLAIYARNLERSVEYAMAIPGVDHEKYAEIMRPDLQTYLRKTQTGDIGFLLMGVVRIFVKHRMPIPYSMILFGRQNTELSGTVGPVIPGKTTLDIMGEELERGLRQKIIQNMLDVDFSRLAYAVSEKVKDSPDRVISIFDQLCKDPFKIVRDFHEAMSSKT
jgi:ubiquinone biosynthesis protein